MGSDDDTLSVQLGAIFKDVDHGVFLKSADGRYRFINPAGARMLGRTPEQVVGACDSDLFDSSDVEDLAALDREILAANTARTYQRTRRTGGVERTLLTTKVPYSPPGSEQVCLVGIVRDISEKSELEQRLAHAEGHLALGVLARGTAHEINNPLTYTLDSLERVDRELKRARHAVSELRRGLIAELGEERANALLAPLQERDPLAEITSRIGVVRQGAERIQEIARSLGRFSASSDDQPTLVDVHELIDHAVSMAAVEIRYRARLQRAYGTVPRIRVRVHGLQQMFLHLVIAHVQAIPTGRSDRHVIRIATRVVDDVIEVSLSDEGEADAGTDRPSSSYSMVRRLVAALGGILSRDIGTDGGRQTVVRLPLGEHETAPPAIVSPRVPEVVDDSDLSSDIPVALSDPSIDVSSDLSQPVAVPGRKDKSDKVRVLIVDDEPMMRLMLRRMVGRGRKTEEAGSGLEAVQFLEQGKNFDLILCDLMMPQMTGMDVFDWLVENRPDLVPRIGFVTGGVFTERGQEFIRTCGRPVLEKPFKRAEVKGLVKQLLA